jgi:hypothetical protein
MSSLLHLGGQGFGTYILLLEKNFSCTANAFNEFLQVTADGKATKMLTWHCISVLCCGDGRYIFCSSAGVYLKSDQLPHLEVLAAIL